jgi:hypothetical protein
MKHQLKPIICLCFSAAIAIQVKAEGFQFYALLDGGIANTKVSGGNATAGKTEFLTGGYAPTFAGVTSEKSLGDGFSGGFQLEQGFLLNPGSSNPWFFSDTSGLFNRRANLYVKSNAGTLTLGTQGNAFFSSLLAVEPRSGSNFGSSLATISGDGQSYKGTVDKGAVSYASPSLAGFGVTVELVPANVDTTVKSGNRFSVKYGGTALTATMASYSTEIAATNTDPGYSRTGALAGAAYTWGDVTLKGMWVKQTTAGFKDLKTTGLGGVYQLTPTVAIDMGVYESKDAAAGYKTSTVGTGIQYKFLKDLTVYGQFTSVKNGGTVTAAYNFAPPMVVDAGTLSASQTGTTMNLGLLYGF